jgi:hypothetical protein
LNVNTLHKKETNIVRVTKLKAAKNLPRNALNIRLIEAVVRKMAGSAPAGISIQVVEKSMVYEFKHQMQLPFPPKDFQKIDKVSVFKLLHKLQVGSTRIPSTCVPLEVRSFGFEGHLLFREIS